jgi:hypothetical protein
VRYTNEQKTEALAKLREILQPGATVHCVLRHVSRSGMSRSISLFAFPPGENSPTDITYWAARALGESIDRKHDGIRIGGCGMDMGFALVYRLSSVLFPSGFGCIGEEPVRCPSNDHSNGDRDYTTHGLFDENSMPENREPGSGEKTDGCRRHWHSSGGYALRHRWM